MAESTPTVDQLMEKAFSPGREPRSDAYKAGVRSVLLYRLQDVNEFIVPYNFGTAEADAYFAGQDEGKAICRALQPSPA